MMNLNSARIGIDEGEVILFSDFEDGGDMWVAEGAREARKNISFDGSYLQTPSVQVRIAMVDMSNEGFMRADLQAENITKDGFEIVFRTWGDTKVARMRVAWQSIGELASEDHWEL